MYFYEYNDWQLVQKNQNQTFKVNFLFHDSSKSFGIYFSIDVQCITSVDLLMCRNLEFWISNITFFCLLITEKINFLLVNQEKNSQLKLVLRSINGCDTLDIFDDFSLWNTLFSKIMPHFWQMSFFVFTKYNNCLRVCWFLTKILAF